MRLQSCEEGRKNVFLPSNSYSLKVETPSCLCISAYLVKCQNCIISFWFIGSFSDLLVPTAFSFQNLLECILNDPFKIQISLIFCVLPWVFRLRLRIYLMFYYDVAFFYIYRDQVYQHFIEWHCRWKSEVDFGSRLGVDFTLSSQGKNRQRRFIYPHNLRASDC